MLSGPAGYVVGALLGVAGVIILARARRGGEVPRSNAFGFSRASAGVVGLVVVVLGYHVAAWAAPPGAPFLCVPRDRWWMLAGAAIASVALAYGADRIEGHGRAP